MATSSGARPILTRRAEGPRGFPRAFSLDARTVIFLTALSVAPFLLLMPLFNAPFERDQGIYATIAEGWMEGALPYRDLWDNKPPLLFLWYMLSFAWFGESVIGPRIMAGIAAGLSVPFVWATAKTLFGRREAGLAAIIFALSFANIYLQVTANAEVFMLLPMTAGLWVFASGARSGKRLSFLAAGVLTSLAVFSRQSAVMAFAGYGVWLIALAWRYPVERTRHLGAIVALAAGGALGALPFVIYFAAHGALYELWHAMFGFNFGWAAEQSVWLKLVPPLLIEVGPLFGGLIFWLLAGIGVWVLWKRNDRAAWLVLSSLVAAEVAAQTMGKGSAHYSIQLLPAAAIAASFGALFVMRRWKERSPKLKWAVAVSSVITVASLAFVYSQPTDEARFEAQYTYRNYSVDAVEAPAIAEATRNLSSPGECVYEWGRSSQIYFLADRDPCSRWVHNRPYQVDGVVIDEIMADLQRNAPGVIVVTDTEQAPPPELMALISQRYRYAGQVNYARLYERVS